MEILSTPLRMTEEENRELLKKSEQRRKTQGDPEGNRHQRRVAARHERKMRRAMTAANQP